MIPIKQIPTNLILLSAVLTLSLFLVSCGGDNGGGTGGGGGSETDVEVIDFTPDSAYAGDEVQVQGLGFSGNAGDNQIWFNETEATTDSVTLTEGSDSGTLYTIVPEGATDGPIAVEAGGSRAESGSDFNVREPISQEEDDAYARVYWVGEKENSNGGVLHRVIGTSYLNDQGRKFSEILYDGEELGELEDANGIGNPWGVALDLNNEMIYWSSFDSSPEFIARASLDGTGTVDTLYSTAQGDPIGFAAFISLDLEAGQIYWAAEDGIVRGSMEGREDAGAEVIYPAGQNGFADFGAIGVDLQLDTENNYVYWTEYEDNEIGRGSLDGSSPLELLYGPSDATPPMTALINDLEVVPSEGKLFTSIGTGPRDSRILMGNTDGSGFLETLFGSKEETEDNDYVSVSSLSYDDQRDYLYWSQQTEGGVIARAKTDGSGQPEIVYDLREIQTEFGVIRVPDIAVIPSAGSAKAKGTGEIPPVYLKF